MHEKEDEPAAPVAAEEALSDGWPTDDPVEAAAEDAEDPVETSAEEPTEFDDGPRTETGGVAFAEANESLAQAPADADATFELEPSPGEEAVGEEPLEEDAACEEAAGEEAGAEGVAGLPDALPGRLRSILGSVLFASDKPLPIKRLKELTGERDGKAIRAALELLMEAFQGTGVVLVEIGDGFSLRTDPENGAWVQKQSVAKPVRLTRAQLETLAIIAYRQPVTRPEIDEIRGVDCAGTVKMLLERGLLRVLGHREEVGRPQLYGTTEHFLEFFNLKSLTELPTLREFHELSEESRARVDALATGEDPPEPEPQDTLLAGRADWSGERPDAVKLEPPDPREEEALLAELDEAASRAERVVEMVNPKKPAEPAASESASPMLGTPEASEQSG
jgi:segregation and condensation protein B